MPMGSFVRYLNQPTMPRAIRRLLLMGLFALTSGCENTCVEGVCLRIRGNASDPHVAASSWMLVKTSGSESFEVKLPPQGHPFFRDEGEERFLYRSNLHGGEPLVFTVMLYDANAGLRAVGRGEGPATEATLVEIDVTSDAR